MFNTLIFTCIFFPHIKSIPSNIFTLLLKIFTYLRAFVFLRPLLLYYLCLLSSFSLLLIICLVPQVLEAHSIHNNNNDSLTSSSSMLNHQSSKAVKDDKKLYKKSTGIPTINHSNVSGSGQVSHQHRQEIQAVSSNQKLNRQRSVTKGRTTVLQPKKNDLSNAELLE